MAKYETSRSGNFLIDRRKLITGSSLVAAGSMLGCRPTPTPAADADAPLEAPEMGFFDFEDGAPDPESRPDLFLDSQLEEEASKGFLPRSGPPSGRHMLYYYDDKEKLLINPGNVTPTLSAQNYFMDLTLRSFHVTKSHDEEFWKKLKDDLQLQLTTKVPIGDSDFLTWLIVSGIEVFGGGREGVDQRLQKFEEYNDFTKQFRSAARIEISQGKGRLHVEALAQRKKSHWKRFFEIFSKLQASPIFATLPIPKLATQGAQFAATVLNRWRQGKDNRLQKIWATGKLDFRLYEGQSAPFALAPGQWVSIDKNWADSRDDDNRNLPNVHVDVPGQFYEVVDSEGRPIDVNYAVMTFEFPKVPATEETPSS